MHLRSLLTELFNLMHLPRSFRTLGIIIGCIVLVLLVWGVYGWIVLQTVSSRAAVSDLIATRDATADKVAYSESLRSLLRDTADARTQLAQVGTLSAVDLVDRIHTLAADAGVDATLDTIAPATFDPSIVPGGAPALTLSISAKGTFTRLYDLLQLMETMPLPLMIDQLSLEHSDDTKNPWMLRARILVYTENAQ